MGGLQPLTGPAVDEGLRGHLSGDLFAGDPAGPQAEQVQLKVHTVAASSVLGGRVLVCGSTHRVPWCDWSTLLQLRSRDHSERGVGAAGGAPHPRLDTMPWQDPETCIAGSHRGVCLQGSPDGYTSQPGLGPVTPVL